MAARQHRPDRISPFAKLVGLSFPETDGPQCELKLEDKVLNVYGTVHGGAISTLADIIMGYALFDSLREDERLATVEMKIYPDKHLPVRREHGKAVELSIEGQPLLSGTVLVHEIEMKLRPPRCIPRVYIRRKNHPMAVGMEKGRKIRSAVIRHLLLIRPVGIHDKNFKPPGLHEILSGQRLAY